MKFTASRLSEGNKVFPAEIHCEQNGLTIKIPGLFSGQSKHLPYNQIGEVSVDAPLVGYSTIHFYTAGTRVSANGFTSSEVKQIKSAIEKGQQGSSTGSNTYSEPVKTGDQIIAEAQAEKIEYELEQQRKHDNAQKPWMNDSNFSDKDNINSISFPNDVEDIEKTTEKIIKAATEQIKSVLGEHNVTAIQHQVGDKNFMKPYFKDFEFVEACVEKAEEGMKKLKRKDDTEHPKLRHIVTDLEESLATLKNKWIPRLEEQRAKKKKKNLIVVAVIILLNIIMFGGLYIASKK
ncbi:MAG: hypothetical protein HY841_04380 [Bacteroidetes bacterium]|nr:hypothetical protein [Bacteroidota bacterium]